jgi:hypothetical protein
MPSSGMWCRMILVRTDASQEHIAFIIGVKRISELRTLAGAESFRPEEGYTFLRNVSSYENHAAHIQEDGILRSQQWKPQILHSFKRLGSVVET